MDCVNKTIGIREMLAVTWEPKFLPTTAYESNKEIVLLSDFYIRQAMRFFTKSCIVYILRICGLFSTCESLLNKINEIINKILLRIKSHRAFMLTNSLSNIIPVVETASTTYSCAR